MKRYSAERALTAEFFVKGKNLAPFVNRISRAGVKILGVKPLDEGFILSIPSSDRKKLFAICGDMCYNIISDEKNLPKNYRKGRTSVIVKRERGYLRPLARLVKRAGLMIGAAAFFIGAAIFDGRLIGYSLGNVPAESRNAVKRTLEENGATPLARFAALDTDALAAAVVRENADIGFATVYKRGSFLIVETLAATVPKHAESKDIVSDESGVIEKIVVLRGTPLVFEGDAVKEGQPLVGAYFTAGEKVIKTTPVAEIYIRADFVFVFNASGCGENYESAAVAVAKEKCPESRIIGQKTEIKNTGGGYSITVTLTYIKKLGG
ncbi:MAG: sporulation protein YqfD [Clostridia bacterium]|nr:sporulation protein YqfD [Clostridia bacterium]